MSKEEKSALEEKLTMKKELIWTSVKPTEKKRIFAFAEEYRRFLSTAKIEREAVTAIVNFAERKGFKPLEKAKRYQPGAKLYAVNRNKNVALIVLGQQPIENGVNIVAAHIDSPRLDLKQNPLYEDSDTQLALLKTHYYGGIKKYQWVSTELAIHGRVITSDGRTIDLCIGEKPEDPVFTIADLLPHLARETLAKRKASEAIKGEELNVLLGSIPVDDENAKQKVKLWVLDYLNKEYGIVEEDFTSAEIEIVPAGPARDVGLDRSMIGGYGQDDRSCAYTAMRAICDAKAPERTAIAIFFDKEEIGSESNTAVQSKFVESVIGDIIALARPNYNDWLLRKVLQRSSAISADVNAGVNPTFKDVHELNNASKLGYGIVITKFTGHGGKYAANDANAEYVSKIRALLNKAKIPWQIGELGKVDIGGGGTVAKFLARHNMDIVDAGPALLGMHSLFEVSNKADIYYTYRAYLEFFNKMKG